MDVKSRSRKSGQEHTLLEDSDLVAVNSISPDAKHIAFMKQSAETGVDQWGAPLDISSSDQPVVGEPEPLVSSPGLDYGAVFSPDGKWIAYGSDHSGAWVVYVQPFPGPGEPREIAEGVWPEWSSNGRQLFLVGPASRVPTVDYEVNGDAFVARQPRVWSNTPIRRTLVGLPYYALHPDGQRIVMIPTDAASPDQAGSTHFGFLLNFFDELRRRAPLD